MHEHCREERERDLGAILEAASARRDGRYQRWRKREEMENIGFLNLNLMVV